MARKNYLIGGPSGSGKTSVYKELIARGHNAIDADSFAYNGDIKTGLPGGDVKHETWIWDSKKINKLLSSYTEKELFVCGDARNRDDFLHCFDVLFELVANEEIVLQRLVDRPGRVWGKKSEERKKVQELMHSGVDRLPNAIIIDATQQISDVVTDILRYLDSY